LLLSAGCTLQPALRPSASERAWGPPQATAPALAVIHDDPLDNPKGFIALSVTGAGFGRPSGGPHLECGWPGSGTFLEVMHDGAVSRFSSRDRRVPVWNDTQVVVKLPSGVRNARVRVCTPKGATPFVPVVYYAYDHFAVPLTEGTNPAPLAVTVDAQHRVWVNQEFHLDLKYLEPATGTFTVLDIPKPPDPGPFAMTVVGDQATQISQNGEAIVSDPSGRIWFTQGGGEPYDGTYPDHSRVVSYDPNAAEDRFHVYNVPGNRNGVMGVTWDAPRRRVWFTQVARSSPDSVGVDLWRARLTSFDPERIPSDGTFDFSTTAVCLAAPAADQPGVCSNSQRPCLTASDCVLTEQICRPDTTDDRSCYRQYELPMTARTYMPGHVAVHPDGSIWYTAFWGGNHIGRLEPDTATFSLFPLPKPRGESQCHYEDCACLTPPVDPACLPCCQLLLFGTGPWDIKVAPTGDLLFTEYFNGAVGRFRIAELGNPACAALAEGGTNPCIDERMVAPEGMQVHSLAIDHEHNVWFTQSGPMSDPSATTSVGYVTAGWGSFVVMPPLSLYPFFNRTGEYCPTEVGAFVSFIGAGISIDPDTGDIWFADYCRKRLGRLRRLR
jgi:streptogramin lyase